ncbi:MAG TPA: hypothetical protein G4O10_02630 [Dehalococcoidia bacterium]|nr:hypothetical protein [Dehalococcoidia bacterium]
MDLSLAILIGMVAVAIGLAFWRGGWRQILAGLKEAVLTFKTVWFRLILGFTLGGLIQVLIPGDLIAEWLGPTSGIKGILIASYAGVVMTGGPYVSLPIVASIYAAGAGPGPVIALLTSMNLLSLPGLLTWAIPFLGAKIALTRYIVCLFLPPLIGFVGAGVFELIS